jgi:hypothetical protein
MGSAKAVAARVAPPSPVVVRRAIVHNLDHLNEDRPFLSEAELELKNESKLKEYFEKHIANVLKDDETGKAVFSSNGENVAEAHCRSILESPYSRKGFVSASQELAKRLFEAMGKDQRIKAGSLALCVFNKANGAEAPHLALVKLDLGEVILQRAGKDTEGHRVVKFEIHDNALPTPREKLHKAALVTADYHLLLLDRQVSEMAASFFARKFLGAEPAQDSKTQTRLYAEAVLNTVKKLKPEETELVLRQFDTALQSKKIPIAPWVEQLPVSDDAKELVLKEIRKKIPSQNSVAINPKYVQQRQLEKTIYRGDFGFRFEVIAKWFNNIVTVKGEKTLDDGTILTTWCLEIPNLKRSK